MPFSMESKGNWDATRNFLKLASSMSFSAKLAELGMRGVEALRAATPIDDGDSARAWSYEVIQTENEVSLQFTNDNAIGSTNVPVVILIQYGHGTNNGGYVEGIDFINPAIQPIFDEIVTDAWAIIKE